MNFFEKLLIGLLQAGATVGPIFVHSQHGLVVLNAGEELLASILAQFAPKPAVAAVIAVAQ